MRCEDNDAEAKTARIGSLIPRAHGTMICPAQLAQLVEHFHGKEGVSGSSPELGFMSVLQMGRP